MGAMHPVAEQDATSMKLAKGWFARSKGGRSVAADSPENGAFNREQSTCDNASLAVAVMLHLR